MALPPLVPVEEFERRLPTNVGTDSVEWRRAQAALEDVSAAVRAEAGVLWAASGQTVSTLPTWLASAVAVPDLVVAVVCAAARRVWVNPDGVRSIDYGEGRGRDFLADSTADVYLKANERAQLALALGVRRQQRNRTATVERSCGPIPAAALVFAAERGYPTDCFR